ncbi:MAG: hypothetical protein JW937_07150, partial [Candidatus Omnitrophica bacterium]|nr:hypothetical protein [Candidatus Omnitrophota bacterium]
EALEQARITGPEKQAIAGRLPIHLQGVEDRQLYARNFGYFKAVHQENEEALLSLEDIGANLAALEERLYPASVQRVLLARESYERTEESLEQYLKGLSDTAAEAGLDLEQVAPSLNVFIELQDLQKRYSEKQLRQEIELYVKEKGEAALEELEDTGNLELPQLMIVQRIQELQSEFKVAELLAQLENLAETCVRELTEDPRGRELFELSERLRLTEQVLRAEAAPRQWRRYSELEAGESVRQYFKNLEKFVQTHGENPDWDIPHRTVRICGRLLENAAGFYRVADERNQALIENTFEFLKTEHAQTGVLIAGGYHSEGLCTLLEEQEMSYVVIAPRVTEAHDNTIYLQRMLSQELRTELSSPRSALSSPRRRGSTRQTETLLAQLDPRFHGDDTDLSFPRKRESTRDSANGLTFTSWLASSPALSEAAVRAEYERATREIVGLGVSEALWAGAVVEAIEADQGIDYEMAAMALRIIRPEALPVASLGNAFGASVAPIAPVSALSDEDLEPLEISDALKGELLLRASQLDVALQQALSLESGLALQGLRALFELLVFVGKEEPGDFAKFTAKRIARSRPAGQPVSEADLAALQEDVARLTRQAQREVGRARVEKFLGTEHTVRIVGELFQEGDTTNILFVDGSGRTLAPLLAASLDRALKAAGVDAVVQDAGFNAATAGLPLPVNTRNQLAGLTGSAEEAAQHTVASLLNGSPLLAASSRLDTRTLNRATVIYVTDPAVRDALVKAVDEAYPSASDHIRKKIVLVTQAVGLEAAGLRDPAGKEDWWYEKAQLETGHVALGLIEQISHTGRLPGVEYPLSLGSDGDTETVKNWRQEWQHKGAFPGGTPGEPLRHPTPVEAQEEVPVLMPLDVNNDISALSLPRVPIEEPELPDDPITSTTASGNGGNGSNRGAYALETLMGGGYEGPMLFGANTGPSLVGGGMGYMPSASSGGVLTLEQPAGTVLAGASGALGAAAPEPALPVIDLAEPVQAVSELMESQAAGEEAVSGLEETPLTRWQRFSRAVVKVMTRRSRAVPRRLNFADARRNPAILPLDEIYEAIQGENPPEFLTETQIAGETVRVLETDVRTPFADLIRLEHNAQPSLFVNLHHQIDLQSASTDELARLQRYLETTPATTLYVFTEGRPDRQTKRFLEQASGKPVRFVHSNAFRDVPLPLVERSAEEYLGMASWGHRRYWGTSAATVLPVRFVLRRFRGWLVDHSPGPKAGNTVRKLHQWALEHWLDGESKYASTLSKIQAAEPGMRQTAVDPSAAAAQTEEWKSGIRSHLRNHLYGDDFTAFQQEMAQAMDAFKIQLARTGDPGTLAEPIQALQEQLRATRLAAPRATTLWTAVDKFFEDLSKPGLSLEEASAIIDRFWEPREFKAWETEEVAQREVRENFYLACRQQQNEMLEYAWPYLEGILPEVFALVNGAWQAQAGIRLRLEQQSAALDQFYGWLAQMRTGEGKTEMSTQMIALSALLGLGVPVYHHEHFDALKNYERNRQIFESIGLTVGRRHLDQDDWEIQQAWNADITYTEITTAGFDMAMRPHLTRFGYLGIPVALVDEADLTAGDNIEAPMIVSMPDDETDSEAAYVEVLEGLRFIVSRMLKRDDYHLEDPDQDAAGIEITEQGLRKLSEWFEGKVDPEGDWLQDTEHPFFMLGQQLKTAMWAEYLEKGSKYNVQQDAQGVPQIRLYNTTTGGLGDRQLQDAHIALCLKEGIPPPAGSVTVEHLHLMEFLERYHSRLAAMTGTADRSMIPALDLNGVSIVPTHFPVEIRQEGEHYYGAEEAKFAGIIEEIKTRVGKGQPVEISVGSDAEVERLAQALRKENIWFQTLTGADSAESIYEKGGLAGLPVIPVSAEEANLYGYNLAQTPVTLT